MYSFLLEMEKLKRKLMLEDMSVPEAQRIFKNYGANLSSVKNPGDLAPIYKKLMLQYHPDRQNGKLLAAQEINAAKDVLKSYYGATDDPIVVKGHDHQQDEPFHDGYWDDVFSKMGRSKTKRPVWAPRDQFDYTVKKNDFTDRNYFAQWSHKMSGGSNIEFTFYAVAGGAVKYSITIFGSDEIWQEMAKAFQRSCVGKGLRPKAMFYIANDMRQDKVSLYYANGRILPEHVLIGFSGEDPSADQTLIRKIDAYGERRDAS